MNIRWPGFCIIGSMRPLIYICVLTFGCFAACQPSRTIMIQNDSTDTAFIHWKIKPDSVPYHKLNLANSDSAGYTLPPSPGNNSITLPVGKGLWTPQEVTKLLDDLEYIEFKTINTSIRLTDHEEMKDFLLERRKNLGKSKILIRLE